MPSAIAKRKADRDPPRPARVAALGDITIAEFILDGRPLDANVVNALNDVSLSRQIDGASAIIATLADPKLALLNSPIFAKAVDLWIDELPFRLADLQLTDDNGSAGLSLEFEPRAIAKMRAQNTPMHASRNDKTRAEFIKALCDKAGVKFVCPRLHEKQPIQSVEDAKTPAQKKADRHPGLKNGVKVKVKDATADSAQLAVLDQALSVAHSLNAVALAQLALIEALIVESSCRNLSGGDRDSRGVLQVRDSTAGPMHISNRDVEACVNAFLTKGFWSKGGAISLASAHPDWDPGQIAQATQGSEFPEAYEHFRSEAKAILEAFGTSAGDVSSPVREEYAIAYMFRTLPAEETQDLGDENYWECARRLTDEVNWRLWEEADTIYFMTDGDIMKSRIEHTITRDAEGVHSVTGQVSTRRPEQEVVIQCDAHRWQAGPGTVCELVGYGPKPTSSHTMTLSGRWLVANIERSSLFALATTITLHRRQKAKLEPAHGVGQRANEPATVDSSGVDLSSGSSTLTGSRRDRVVQAAKQAAKRSASDSTYYYYSQSGDWKYDLFARDAKGLGPQGLPGGPSNRSDCSSFVIQCYTKAGCPVPESMKGKGFTGTLADEGTKTSKPQPGDVCLYGTYPYHHVELFIGDGKTIGHGDAKVDYSTPSGAAGYWTFSFLNDDAPPSVVPKRYPT
jgi:cell wall-associated NlpC family hydrolase